jgi:hypothetical protein
MAARFLIPGLLASTALLTGCSNATTDLQLARSEAQYLPIEVGATMAMGMLKAAQFAEITAGIQADGTTVGLEMDPACVGAEIVDSLGGADLRGAVRYDFRGCSSSTGFLDVTQQVVVDGANGERDVPEGWDGTLPGGDDLEALLNAGESVSVGVDFVSFEEGMLAMDGGIALDGGAGGGELAADFAVSALDYGGDLSVDGSWAPGLGPEQQVLSFSGSFVSSADLAWTVVADGIVLDAECADARGGELRATFTNAAGRVEVRAVFSPSCDGCASVFVNDVAQGDTCFDPSLFIGG